MSQFSRPTVQFCYVAVNRFLGSAEMTLKLAHVTRASCFVAMTAY